MNTSIYSKSILGVLFILCLFLASCGYKFSANNKPKFSQEIKTIAVGDIESSTIDSWIVYGLHQILREGLQNRNWFKVVDKKTADALLNITIHRFYTTTSLEGLNDVTLESSAYIAISAELVTQAGKIIWRSGNITKTLTYTGNNELTSKSKILEDAVQQMFFEMNNNNN